MLSWQGQIPLDGKIKYSYAIRNYYKQKSGIIMKTIIQNLYFEKSPLSAHLKIDEERKKNVRHFELSLYSDRKASLLVAGCKGVFFDDDIESLCKCLEELTDGDKKLLSYAPMEPSFLLRGQIQADNSIELIWIVDQGIVDANYSTDTGVGLLMNISSVTATL